MENKHNELLADMKDQKNMMKSLYSYQLLERPTDPASFHWVTVHRSLDALVERMNVANLKAQKLQHVTPATEKDTLNLLKMLELIHAVFLDYNKIYKEPAWKEQTSENTAATFENLMGKVKQQIDLISFEVTKLKTVNEALENIISNYKLEFATMSSDQENEQEDQNELQNNVSLQ